MGLPTVVGVGAEVASTGPVTPPFPIGYVATADDVGLIWVECDSSDVIVAPGGWPEITNSTVTTGTADTKLTLLGRRIVVGDAAPTIPDAGTHMIARMIIIRGCIPTGNPWDGFASNTELVADTTVSIPCPPTSVDNCLILASFGTGESVASNAGATGWANPDLANIVEQMDDWTASGTGGGFAMASGEKAVAGLIADMTATLSLTANFKTLIAIALKGPAAGGTGAGGAELTHPLLLARPPRQPIKRLRPRPGPRRR